MKDVYDSFHESVLMPKLFRLGPNLYAAQFFLMKLLPAYEILTQAANERAIVPGSTIVETTSGTFGLALAILANQFSYRCRLVSDPAMDRPLLNRVAGLGTIVDIVAEPAPVGGYQQARLERLHALLANTPGSFWPQQYTNEQNPRSYARLAEYLLTNIGHVDALVGTVGSGGSTCGTAASLRSINPGLKLTGVDTANSVLFGQSDGKRLVRGLGNSIMPKILDHAAFDEVHWLAAPEVFKATRELHTRHGLFSGPTSGAAYRVAKHLSEESPEKTIVFICADEGYRYLTTAFDDEWLSGHAPLTGESPSYPQLMSRPTDEVRHWGWMPWGRRSLAEILLPEEGFA